MDRWRTLRHWLVAALAALGLGLGGAWTVPLPDARAAAAPAPSGTITLYTSESEDDVNALAGDFMKRTPGVTVKIFRAGTGPVEAKIEAEEQAGRIQADVLWFADPGFLHDLSTKGQLGAYAPPAAHGVPREFHYDGNQYHEVRLIFNVIGYNTLAVHFKPTSWWDLAKPRYKGRAGMPNPFVSGAAFAGVGTFASMKGFGWDYYRALKQNNMQIIQANGDVLQKLASGEVVVAQIVDFFVRHAKADGSPVDYIVPSEGALVIPTPVAIVKGTGNLVAAQAFVNYLYTPAAQALFVQRSYIPVLPGVALPPGVPPLSSIKIIQPNLPYIAQHREDIKKTFTEIFGIQ
ncbi:MAG TPA: ABC transporter substrate-binding protein [bacterium]|nr:ABC transporter substrate-binding protein [bacterium]